MRSAPSRIIKYVRWLCGGKSRILFCLSLYVFIYLLTYLHTYTYVHRSKIRCIRIYFQYYYPVDILFQLIQIASSGRIVVKQLWCLVWYEFHIDMCYIYIYAYVRWVYASKRRSVVLASIFDAYFIELIWTQHWRFVLKTCHHIQSLHVPFSSVSN